MSTGSAGAGHKRLTEDEVRSLRRFITATLLNGQVTADAAGLHPVDLYVLNLVDVDGAATAGELAKHTGLTTGAITKLVDRLVRSGLVERARDPADRRRVVIRIIGKATAETLGGASAPLFAPVATRMDRLISGFTDEQRAVLAEFFDLAADQLRHATEDLQQGRRASGGDASRPDPRE
ncbi:MarR family winged helix-turn-helix transcriptional regulator [Streptomonospora salina]|uniref:DNA-binding MarR family transcriptional regulator n=1 Tax=Streptomonospora salina TaxID=104205 RepID=A0A841EH62_9ACTN|nr:MarR family transcriptional regulator [Streptomonospora salina]MBB6000709.1 DNA-binding MarR family transcriptional regulator [Streptomonospora salina]